MQEPVANLRSHRGRAIVALALAAGMWWLLWMLVVVSPIYARPDLLERHPRLESALRDLAAAHSAGDVSATADLAARYGVRLVDGLVQVVVVGNGKSDQSAIAQQIEARGGQVERVYGPWTQAQLPVEALLNLAAAPGVRFVRRPWLPLPTTTSEGVAVTRADEQHGAGLTGQGVKVGVVDPGFLGYANRISEGELPSDVITKSFVGSGSEIDFWGGTPHGVACAEVVHDMAPDAQLYLVNFNTEVEWANAVDWLLTQGVDAISFSAGWPVGGPGDGTGTLAEKVSDVRNAGVLWVGAAGNSAQKHWMDQWSDPDEDGWHNFGSTKETNEITVTSESQIVIGLRWSDVWGSSGNDYDLFLFDSTVTEIARSENVQDGDDDPVEIIRYYFPSPGVYRVAISKQPGAQTRTLELFSYEQDFYYQTAAGSLLVPADSPGSLTVGATYWQDDALEDFSSQGPTRDGRTKPDLAAPDGVSVRTEAYAGGFYGTSASAPHVAGGVALALEALPTLTPAQAQNWLEDRAVDLGAAGKDYAYGAGRLNLPIDVIPGAAPVSSTVTLDVSGIPFAPSATFYLARAGHDALLPSDVTWISMAQLSGTVTLSGTAPGPWDVVVTNTSSITVTFPRAFLVATDHVFLPLIAKNASP